MKAFFIDQLDSNKDDKYLRNKIFEKLLTYISANSATHPWLPHKLNSKR